ncbi:uncharacterized protein LOC143325029 isoform X2 [Chaetodon auriga]|uniref:uncharacterized protein LOC143325029 isoform X2 n=1 Tax=Chaetodon auriga TaxID=39042 RepID=UPI0040331079
MMTGEKCDGLKWRSSENCIQVPFSVVHIARRPPHRDFPLHQVWQSESQRRRSPGLDRAVRIYKMEKNEDKDELDGEKNTTTQNIHLL